MVLSNEVSQQSTLLARRHDLGHRMSGVSVQCRAQGGRAVVVKALSVLGEYVFLHRRPQQHICVSARRDLFRGSSLAQWHNFAKQTRSVGQHYFFQTVTLLTLQAAVKSSIML